VTAGLYLSIFLIMNSVFVRPNATAQGRQTCGATNLEIAPDFVRGTDF